MTPGQPPDPASHRHADSVGNGAALEILAANARTLGMVLDNMSDLVAMLDTEGRRLYNSPSYRAVFGDRDLAGTDSFLEIHPEDRERVRRVFRETVASGVGQRTQYRFLLADGSIRYIESQGDVIKDAGGKVTHVVVVARDITERKLFERTLEESNKQLVATVQLLEQRHRQNLILGKLGDLMQMCKSVEESRGVVAQYADELFPGTSGNLYLRNFANELFETAASWGEAALAGDPVIGKDDCWALRRGQMHVIEDARSKLVCQHLMVPPAGPCLCAPILGNGELLGLLHVQLGAEEAHLPGPVRLRRLESQQVWALTVAEQIALALVNLRLRESLSAQAVRDSLTGLYNRRYLEQVLEREVLRAARNGRPVGVIMLDLDHFKNFNDSHGHEAGDMLLRVLGDYLVTHVRAEDIACRYGGEEFVVILPEASPAMSRSRAEELWKGVQGLHINFHGELLRGVTASVGVAAFPGHGRTAGELLGAADAAMYAAKRRGRDCVEIAEQSKS
ncbi:MAG: diguanylate cyclase [Betaproteobacteria bacterium]|nr:diguanylate cyclase [Betaproteobacteria bacterium]